MNDHQIESLAPRESKLDLKIGPKVYACALTEMTIRQQNKWEDACLDVDRKTLESIGDSSNDTNAVLLLRSDDRARVLKSMLSFASEVPSDGEMSDLRFSQVEQIFLTQAKLNRRSDVVGEVQNLLNRVAQQVPTSSAQVTSAPVGSPSSDDSGPSISVTPSPPSITSTPSA